MSVSNIITQAEIEAAKKTISDLEAAKNELKLAIAAKLPINYTEADIDEQIDRLKLFIQVYEGNIRVR